MTKLRLAEKILEHVDNCDFMGEDRLKKLEGVLAYLDTLEPKNLGQFAQWGHPEDKSVPKDCWV